MSADKVIADRKKRAKRKAKLKQKRYITLDRRRRKLLRRGQKGGRRR
jgi:hypothetical protein